MSNVHLMASIAILLVVTSPLTMTVQEHGTEPKRKTPTDQARKEKATAEAVVR